MRAADENRRKADPRIKARQKRARKYRVCRFLTSSPGFVSLLSSLLSDKPPIGCCAPSFLLLLLCDIVVDVWLLLFLLQERKLRGSSAPVVLPFLSTCQRLLLAHLLCFFRCYGAVRTVVSSLPFLLSCFSSPFFYRVSQ